MSHTRWMPLLAPLLLAAFLSGCSTQDDGTAETPDGLTGRVRLPGGGAAVDAMVRAYPVDYGPADTGAGPDPKTYYSATTGKDGVYAFKDVPAGVYNILVSKNGLNAFRDSVTVTGSDQSLPVETLNPPGALVGRVELQPHHPTLGAVVEVLGTPVFAAVDEDGDFRLAGLAPGTYRLRAHTRLPDYASAHREAAVRSQSTDTLSEPLRPFYSGAPNPGFTGRVRRFDGGAAVGAEVWAYPADYVPGDTGAQPGPKAYFSATTGAGGIYIFEDVPAGVYNILASMHGWKAFRGSVTVTGASQTLPADTLKLPGVLGGQVVLQENHPTLAAVVQVLGTPVVATVDELGRFQLPPLAPGTYRLRAHSVLLDYAPAYREAVIQSGTGYLLEEPLRPAYSGAPTRLLIGRVRLVGDRGPAAGVMVRVCPVDHVPEDTSAVSAPVTSGCFTTTTGAGGIYSFSNVPGGVYNLLLGRNGTEPLAFRDSVAVTGLIQSLSLDILQPASPLVGRLFLQPHHSARTARVQVLGTPIVVNVREDSTFVLPIAPGTYRLRAYTVLPDYAPAYRDVVHPGPGDSLEPIRPAYSGIPALIGLSAQPGPDGTVLLTWNKPDYGPVEAYLVYRDSVDFRDSVESPLSSTEPYARVGRTDTAWIDTVYSRAPRAGQHDYADTLFHEHAYRVRILDSSGAMGPLFHSVRGRAVPPTREVEPEPEPEM